MSMPLIFETQSTEAWL